MKTLEPSEFAGNWKKFSDFCWYGQPNDADDWGIYYFSTRDSRLIEQSNSQAIKKEMEELGDDDNFRFETHSHWAFGYVEGISIRVYDEDGGLTPSFLKLQEIIEKLQDYPLLNEEDYSQREYDSTIENLESELYHATNKLEDYWEEKHFDDNKEMPKVPTAEELFTYIWHSDQQELLENKDDSGGWVDSEKLFEIILEIWDEQEKERLAEIERKSGQMKLF